MEMEYCFVKETGFFFFGQQLTEGLAAGPRDGRSMREATEMLVQQNVSNN